jgi:hypothetical protein
MSGHVCILCTHLLQAVHQGCPVSGVVRAMHCGVPAWRAVRSLTRGAWGAQALLGSIIAHSVCFCCAMASVCVCACVSRLVEWMVAWSLCSACVLVQGTLWLVGQLQGCAWPCTMVW